jgi:hypothetical protein
VSISFRTPVGGPLVGTRKAVTGTTLSGGAAHRNWGDTDSRQATNLTSMRIVDSFTGAFLVDDGWTPGFSPALRGSASIDGRIAHGLLVA